jgi:probable rRNA maturation factor
VQRAGTQRIVADARLARAVAVALEASGAPRPGSVTLVLSDDAELAELNAEHMGHEGPTDVLSFPMLPPDAFPAPAENPRGQAPGSRQARRHIGDIAVSLERAAEQAEAGRGGQTGNVRWSAPDELRLLVIHGTLHLGGRDHADPGDEAGMRALEGVLLERTRR